MMPFNLMPKLTESIIDAGIFTIAPIIQATVVSLTLLIPCTKAEKL